MKDDTLENQHFPHLGACVKNVSNSANLELSHIHQNLGTTLFVTFTSYKFVVFSLLRFLFIIFIPQAYNHSAMVNTKWCWKLRVTHSLWAVCRTLYSPCSVICKHEWIKLTSIHQIVLFTALIYGLFIKLQNYHLVGRKSMTGFLENISLIITQVFLWTA